MELTQERPPEAPPQEAPPDGLSLSSVCLEAGPAKLGSLPVGARLILRCRADWRAATVASFEQDLGRVVLNVASPSGHTYRVRRPAEAALAYDGHLPVLGEGQWRAGLARYDVRW
ncbi:MAG TPA: hypothetical protein VF521_19145 [Pyrinomonadaceae bacterium]